MINKYNSVKVTSVLRIISLLLVLMLAPLSNSAFIQAATPVQVSEIIPDPIGNDIINPGLDPNITLSSNSVFLASAANSTAEVNATSNIVNIPWTATVSPSVSWLKVSPVSTTGNQTITFTSIEANNDISNPRTAYVVIHATGIPDQTITVTQSQEIPAFTFTSQTSNGSLSINLQFSLAGTFFIDWGNGIQTVQTASTSTTAFSTATFHQGDQVKVYGSGITYISLSNKSITALDVHNSPNLTSLDCSYNSINSLSVSQNTLLNNLSVGFNNLSVLDISKNTSLQTLSCISNKLTSLDVSKSPLTKLYCYQNNMTFTSLPQRKSSYTVYYYYAPQAKIPTSITNNKVDLSNQLNATDINGVNQITTYKWYTKTNGTALTQGTDYTESNGVFTFLTTQSDSLYCSMMNTAFPDFTGANTLRSVNLKVTIRIPTVVTNPISNINGTTATGNGNITDLGIPNPTQYGVVWSTTPNPTVALSTLTSQGAISSTGTFSSSISGLAQGTTYYVRAYATNTAGTAYGADQIFTSAAPVITTPAPTSLTGFTAFAGTASASQTFTVGGSLANALIITAPAGYELRESGTPVYATSVSFTPVSGIVPTKTIEIRIAATALVGIVSGNVVCTSTGAITQNVAVTGTVSLRPITVTAVTDSKTYDGTTGSKGIPTIVGVLGTGDVAVLTQVYDNATVGIGHIMTASVTINNSLGKDVTANYKITNNTVSTGVITQASLTVTAVTDSKTYDGTTSSKGIPTITGGALIPGDVAVLKQVYDNSNVGTTHTMTASVTINNSLGTDVTLNYNIKYVTISTGVITQAPYTVNAAPQTKVYDGTVTSSVVPTRVGTLITGDVVNTEPVQVYDNANVGNTHVMTASGLTIKKSATGENVTANYNITYNTATGIITQAPLTVTAVSNTKVYDGTTVSAGIPTVGTLVPGDAVNASAIQVFDNANVGSGHVLTPSGLTIKKSSTGENVTANYNITYATNAGGVITAAPLTVTAVTDTKVYDGTVSSVGQPIVGTLVTGDAVNVAPIQIFDNILVGNTHVLIASGLTIKKISTGENVTANYNIQYVNSLADGVILGIPLTASNPTITNIKVYDGSPSAMVIPGILSGVAALDIPNVVLTAIATYDNANTGSGKTITVTYGLSGSASSIYAAPSNFSITNGEITAKPLTVSTPMITESKVYDGNSTASVTPGILSGVEAADIANVSVVSVATYDNANVGSGKTINVTYGLSGSAATNYIAPLDYTVTNGIITGKTLTVISLQLATSKIYDGTTTVNFAVGSLSGVVQADIANVLLTGSASYDNANAGTGKTITVTYNISGTASGNYLSPLSYTITNGEILAKLLTISDPVVVKDKLVDGNTTAVITSLGSLQGVEATDVNNLNVTATADYNDITVGIDKTITVVYTLSGSASGNYLAPADFVITGAIITDNVSLSPTITSTAGCEDSYLDLNYTVLTGTPTQYQITFSASTLAAGIQNINYTDLPSNLSSGVLPVLIPKGTKYGNYQGTLQMKNELGIESPVYNFQFTINVSSDFIIPKFDDVVLCDNSSNLFTGYQWYKNGVAIEGATKQFYNDLDGLIGSYSLQVTTTDGQTLFTCSKVLNVPLKEKISVFPSPLKMNQPCTVKLTGMSDTDLAGSELSVYSVQGILVYHSTKVEKLNSIYLPTIDGMYLGNVTTKDGQVFPFKVIVTK